MHKDMLGRESARRTRPPVVNDFIDGEVIAVDDAGNQVSLPARPLGPRLGGCKCAQSRQASVEELRGWLRQGRRVVKVPPVPPPSSV